MKYFVGIDLGTTNSVVAYASADPDSEHSIEILKIPQVTAAGTVEARDTLPSFLYLPAPGELPEQALRLPWAKARDHAVGVFARQRGAEVPDRVISSAKSWLSFGEVDRSAAILPWGGPPEVAKLSPVEVARRYLEHIREAWDASIDDAPLAEQEILVTVPASFDEVARDLTLRAARDAGLGDVTLLEEPQAAFYAWIDSNGDAWRDNVRVDDLVLVCDVGGGTTDLSLIAVRDQSGEMALERVAVGDHILLGGDNMDLALAYRVRERLAKEGTQLDNWQFRGLIQSCRQAKERLLDETHTDSFAIAILGRGRKVIGGTLRVEVSRAEVKEALIDGFFPATAVDTPLNRQQRAGLQEIGLPYASDPGVTRHIASFLRTHGGGEGRAAQPTTLLFNGGAMNAPDLRRRLVEVIESWFDGEPPRVLQAEHPERAVARGAAYYGLARRGRGVRIRGGIARSYYIGIESAMPAVPGMRPPLKALCVVPRGLEEGSEVDLPAREFGLAVGEPAEFRFLSSTGPRDDEIGSLHENWSEEELEELSPLATTLQWKGKEGATVPIHLQARVNELGVLELWCVSRDDEQRWKLEFNVRVGGD
jgi:molecular chaperone DnaK (HSP70)